MRSSLLLAALAVLFLLPATALAFRFTAGDPVAQTSSYRSLRMGDQGALVAELQELLAARGFDPGPVDGIFGPLTLSAVLSAQRHYGLEPDGLAGRLTLGALRGDNPAVEQAVAATVTTSAAVKPAVARAPQGASALAMTEKGALLVYEAGPARSAAPSAERIVETSVNPPPAPVGEPSAATSATPAGEVALTFNHLPGAEELDRLLAALADRSLTATFFVTGEEAEAHPEQLRQIHEAGHEIGNLGYSLLDMRRLSPVTAAAHLRRTQRAIQSATGAAPTAFRPPSGLFDRKLEGLAASEGLRMTLWSNITLFPEPELEPELLADRLTEQLFPGMVVMLPLDDPHGVETAHALLDRLGRAGYQSRTLRDMAALQRAISTAG